MVHGTTQSRSCFRCQKKKQYHLTELFYEISVQMVSAAGNLLDKTEFEKTAFEN